MNHGHGGMDSVNGGILVWSMWRVLFCFFVKKICILLTFLLQVF